MTTEQMDWLDDERAGRHARPAPALEGVLNTSAVEFRAPVQAGTISAFVDALPANAVVVISPAMRVEGYRLEASW